jgi:hypothetical protein
MARRLVFTFAALVSLGVTADAEPPRGKGPRAPKTVEQAREAITKWLETTLAEANRRGDETAAQALAAVGVHFGRADAPVPLTGSAAPKDETWLDGAVVAVTPAALFLVDQKPTSEVVAGQIVRQLPEAVRALRVLNRYRKDVGIPPVRLDGARCAGPILHARYLLRNGLDAVVRRIGTTHDELETDPWYTPEGRASARAGNIGQTSLSAGVDRCIHTYYHRPILLEPAERSIAMGWWGDRSYQVCCLEPCGDLDPEFKGSTMVCFPAPDGAGISPGFATGGERPEPVPGVSSTQLGNPVTVTFFSGVTSVTAARIEVFDGKTSVEGYLSTPERPSNPDAHVRFLDVTCGFLPAKPFRPRTTYEVRATATLDGDPWEKTWRFTTASAPPPPR